MSRKMKDGYLAEEGLAQSVVGNYINCNKYVKTLTYNKSKAIHTFSSKGIFGRKNHSQFCTWKCAESYHS